MKTHAEKPKEKIDENTLTPFEKVSHKFRTPKSFLLLVIFLIFCLWSVAPVSANTTIDLSSLTGLLEQTGDMMPHFGNLAIAVVPVIFVFIVIGFVTGLFDSLLSMIKNVLK